MPRRGMRHETRVSLAVAESIRASGLSLRAFAKLIGVSAAYLSDLTRGHRPLSDTMAERLSGQKPRRSVRDWLLLQLDDDLDALKSERRRIANAS